MGTSNLTQQNDSNFTALVEALIQAMKAEGNRKKAAIAYIKAIAAQLPTDAGPAAILAAARNIDILIRSALSQDRSGQAIQKRLEEVLVSMVQLINQNILKPQHARIAAHIIAKHPLVSTARRTQFLQIQTAVRTAVSPEEQEDLEKILAEAKSKKSNVPFYKVDSSELQQRLTDELQRQNQEKVMAEQEKVMAEMERRYNQPQKQSFFDLSNDFIEEPKKKYPFVDDHDSISGLDGCTKEQKIQIWQSVAALRQAGSASQAGSSASHQAAAAAASSKKKKTQTHADTHTSSDSIDSDSHSPPASPRGPRSRS